MREKGDLFKAFKEAFFALVDGAQQLLVLYHTPSLALEAAQKYARSQGKEVYAYYI